MTAFQEATARAIHRETAARFKKYAAKYGPEFVDVIIESPDKHGRGRAGFSCMFGGYQTYRGGAVSVVDFARRGFEHGRLRKVIERWHDGQMVTTYVVFK
jgi:hypothetical protein